MAKLDYAAHFTFEAYETMRLREAIINGYGYL